MVEEFVTNYHAENKEELIRKYKNRFRVSEKT